MKMVFAPAKLGVNVMVTWKLKLFPLLTSWNEIEGILHWLFWTVALVPVTGLQAEASSLASQNLLVA